MTQGTRNDLKPRPVDQFRLYTRNLFEGDVGEQNDGVELSPLDSFLLISGGHLFQRHVEPGAHLSQRGRNIVTILTGQSQSEGRTVFRQQHSGAIMNFTARGENHLLAKQIALCLARIVRPPVDLKKPETRTEYHEQQSNGALQQNQPRTWRLIFLGIIHELHGRTCG